MADCLEASGASSRCSRRIRSRCFLTWLFLILIAPVAVLAQPVIDPQTVEFDPSADHSTLTSAGTPMLTRYDLEFYLVGAAKPFQVVPMGKPAVQGDGKIRVPISTLGAMPSSGIVYESAVAALGPGGIGRSARSNTFQFSGSGCNYSVSPINQMMSAAGGPASVSVTVGTGCGWTATSNAAWLTVGATAKGSGNGTAGYTVAANTGGAPRTGTLTVAGVTITVQQSNTTCASTVSPTINTVGPGGGSTSFSVTTGDGCNWSASTNTAWLTITSGTSGSGNGTVDVSVPSNPSTLSRTGALTIAGTIVNVKQNGAGSGTSCVGTVTPTSQVFTSAGGNATVAVTAGECTWTSTSQVSWLTITAGASGTDNGTVAYTAAANTSTSPRSGTLTVAGQTVSITQSGVSTCKPSVSPLSNTVAASGGSTNFTVTAGGTCGWTAGTNTSWLTITSGSSGTGNGTVVVSVPANTSPLSRTGALTISGVVVNVKQNAGSCSYAVSPTSQTIAGGGDVASITVTAGTGCSWTAFTSANWITITAGSGSGNGSVAFSVAANTGSSSRTASVLVGGKSVSVTQSAGQLNPPSNVTVTPTGN